MKALAGLARRYETIDGATRARLTHRITERFAAACRTSCISSGGMMPRVEVRSLRPQRWMGPISLGAQRSSFREIMSTS